MKLLRLLLLVLVALSPSSAIIAQSTPATSLEQQLLAESTEKLIADIKANGNARRGAITFFQPFMACSKCHMQDKNGLQLGPALTNLPPNTTDAHIVESILKPSAKIHKGFETITVVTDSGKTMSGLLHSRNATSLILKDLTRAKLTTFDTSTIDDEQISNVSLMPAGQVNVLTSRQQFLDLVRYVLEIRDGGPAKEKELRPAASLYASKPVPAYEQKIDHAGMLAALDDDSFKRGEAIYNRLCINCHGTHDAPGSLPTSLRFGSGKFKNGNDPHSMYRTITYGFGMMVPQTWMVPQQKYDVIHYIREAYLKKHNPTQLAKIDDTYLKTLPEGTTRGPAAVNIERWATMDYGSSLINTYEIGTDGHNFAYKAIATRLDSGPGGIANGEYWMAFDHDTLRTAAAWQGKGFIDWNGIHFNGRHAIHPRVVGDVQFENVGPGWGNPETGSFEDPRLVGRDGRKYGPLPREWAHYKGLYHFGDKSIIKYTVGTTEVLEMPGVEVTANGPRYTRSMNLGRRDKPMILQVVRHSAGKKSGGAFSANSKYIAIEPLATELDTRRSGKLKFDGSTHLQIQKSSDAFDMQSDYTITARIKTKADGAIFTFTKPNSKWVPDGKSLFIRNGRLTFDIGWVGAVSGKKKITNGKPTNVALTYTKQTGIVRLYVNGRLDGQQKLRPKNTNGSKGKANDHAVIIGYTSSNFPNDNSHFNGDIQSVRFHNRVLTSDELKQVDNTAVAKGTAKNIVADFQFNDQSGTDIPDVTGQHTASVIRDAAVDTSHESLLVYVREQPENSEWQQLVDGNLRLMIPAGPNPLRFTVCVARLDPPKFLESGIDQMHEDLGYRFDSKKGQFYKTDESLPLTPDLTNFIQGGPPRWPQPVITEKIVGNSDGPFGVDVLTRPENNPWLALVRLSGFDFYPGGDKAAVSAWDGDVWTVEGLNGKRKDLTWKRIASGLFQPLGVKVIDGKIHCTCRDQLVVLHDLNDDGETDFYQSLNNDHQVTDHFHEFAMGLQTDAEGNFYYAKSARHAKTALVPHHGTLLKISKDGSKTDIIATGFRAANGVCLNPDGSFIVTDQEGHWNPKNRINWVQPGGFYGNMFGYHDVSNEADEAMDQPLCWITNKFDRSPAELLWVDSKKWGPLDGMLLNLSYGYGKVFVVPHENIDGQMQGGMVELPIPQFPTGVMRGRFSPDDGQLYTCGMFAWAGSQQQPGGFYRIRYTGKPVHLPVKLAAKQQTFEIEFSGEIDPESAANPSNYSVKIWDLKRTANYGSKHYNEQDLKVSKTQLSADGRTVVLEIPQIKPTWGMEVTWELRDPNGKPIKGRLHNTIHKLRQ